MAELTELLRSCGVMTLRELGIEDDVAAGRADIGLDELRMDSLAVMEFCIGLEQRWNFVVEPVELAEMGTLGHLAALIEGAHGR